jgi:hypothetical protein
MVRSRLRRSILCMVRGFLVIGPAIVFFWGSLVDWKPHTIVVVTLAAPCIVGIIWLYDEIRDIRAGAKGAATASENPFRAWNPDAFDKGAKINRAAAIMRRASMA